MLCTVAAIAQPKAGTFSIIPRLGVSIATTNDKLAHIDGQSIDPKYKAGFTGGVDLDYQATSLLSVSLGAYYTMQGNRFGSWEYDTSVKNQSIGVENARLSLSYLSVPLMANVYVSQGLAVKAGLQADIALDGKYAQDETTVTKLEDGTYNVGQPQEVKTDYPLKSFGLTIPVGLSYEYMNVVLDARYNFGLSNIYDGPGDSVRKSSFLFTIGYRFAL